uniref:CSON004381 protein n=1 Tax=Culicoides sonorensis TaxID=179676 RepID=A0A336MR74_CULSO
MRHHHPNMEMLHPKALHYPSGFPMPRSPPLFICSSPGPDPYRSHDNVYEELEHRHETDSERAHHSDDEFAEDELSLPGERSFQKSSPDTTTVATIYQERSNSSSNGAGSSSANDAGEPAYTIERNRTERNSLLSSSSSGNDNQSGGTNSQRQIRNSNSSSDCGGSNSNNGLSLGLFRCRSSNNNSINNKNNSVSRQIIPNTFSADELNGTNGEHPSSVSPITGTDIPPTIYDERSLMSLPPSYSSGSVNNNSNVNNLTNNNSVNNVNNLNNNRANYYGPVEDPELSEVERRNRINSQLSSHPVATIFRERSNPRIHHHHHMNPNRTRTNPRSLDRRRYINPQQLLNNPQDPNYLYQEPIFHEGMLYDACLSNPYSTPYQIIPEFSTFRQTHHPNGGQHHPPSSTMAVYSRDSSFGSDSGYSHNTQNSNRSNNTNNVMPNNTNNSSSNSNSWWGRGRSKGNRNNRGSRSGTLTSLNRDS